MRSHTLVPTRISAPRSIAPTASPIRDGPFGYHVTLIEQELMDFTGKLHDFEVRARVAVVGGLTIQGSFRAPREDRCCSRR